MSVFWVKSFFTKFGTYCCDNNNADIGLSFYLIKMSNYRQNQKAFFVSMAFICFQAYFIVRIHSFH